MIATEFRTDALPTTERFTSWYDLTCQAHVATTVNSDHKANFLASVHALDLGAVQITRETFPALHARRTAQQIRQSDPEQIHLVLFLSGNASFLQADRYAKITFADFLIYDTWRPFNAWAIPAQENTCSCIRVQIPRTLLPLTPHTIDQLIARRLSGSEGVGAVVSQGLQNLTNNTLHYRATDSPHLRALTLDLVATLLACQHDAENSLPPESCHHTILACIRNFIDQNLPNPSLSPQLIATAHHVSLRYLHRLFQRHGLTTAGYIRQRRLERCYRDLANPKLHAQPIHTIAARWGFHDNSHFSRAFRAAFDITPREHRYHAHPRYHISPEGSASTTKQS